MKKEINKLRLNKKTISNLRPSGITIMPGAKKLNDQFIERPTKRGLECFTHKCQPSW